LIGKYFSDKIPHKLLHEVEGSQLKGLKYDQLMPFVQPDGKAFEVIIGDFVTTEEGTGIVHTASLFGADDFRVCKENGIASVLVKDDMVSGLGVGRPLVPPLGSLRTRLVWVLWILEKSRWF
jgi:isoleucyl-tRNA synthetase